MSWWSKSGGYGSTEDVGAEITALRDKKGKRVFKPRYSTKDVFRIDTTTDADRARVLGPILSCHSDHPPLKAFRKTLVLLDQTGFDWMFNYSGPRLGIEVEGDEMPSIEQITDRLARMEGVRTPWGGFKAILVYKRYRRIRATVKVTGRDASKVKVRVKGPVLKADWIEFKRRMTKHVEARR